MGQNKNNSHKATPPKKILGLTKTKRKNIYKGIGVIASIITIFLFSIWLINEDKLDRIITLLENIDTRLDPKNPPDIPVNYLEIKKDVEEELVSEGYVNPEILIKMGNIEFYQNEYNNALHYYEVARSLIEKNKKNVNLNAFSTVISNIGLIHSVKREFGKALNFQKTAIGIDNIIGDSLRIARCLDNLGQVYSEIDSLDKALENYSDALSLFRQYNDSTGEASTLNNIGVLLIKQKNLNESFVNLTSSLDINEAINDSLAIGNNLCNIGLIYYERGEYNTAYDYYWIALNVFCKIKNRHAEALCLYNIGLVFGSIKDFENALEYFENAYFIFQEINLIQELQDSQIQINRTKKFIAEQEKNK